MTLLRSLFLSCDSCFWEHVCLVLKFKKFVLIRHSLIWLYVLSFTCSTRFNSHHFFTVLLSISFLTRDEAIQYLKILSTGLRLSLLGGKLLVEVPLVSLGLRLRWQCVDW